MELKQFIKTAIVDITDAIHELQDNLANGAIVNPSMPHPVALKTIKQDGANRLISEVRFDVVDTADFVIENPEGFRVCARCVDDETYERLLAISVRNSMDKTTQEIY